MLNIKRFKLKIGATLCPIICSVSALSEFCLVDVFEDFHEDYTSAINNIHFIFLLLTWSLDFLDSPIINFLFLYYSPWFDYLELISSGLHMMQCMQWRVHTPSLFLWIALELVRFEKQSFAWVTISKANLILSWMLLFSFWKDCISNGVPLEDFGHGHPDPNLTWAILVPYYFCLVLIISFNMEQVC